MTTDDIGRVGGDGKPQIEPADTNEPVTFDAALVEIENAKRGVELDIRDVVETMLRQMARDDLGEAEERMRLNQLAQRTGVTVTTLKRTLHTYKLETAKGIAIWRQYVFVKEACAFWDRQARKVFDPRAVQMIHWRDMPLDEDDLRRRLDPLHVLLDGTFCPPCDAVDAITFVPGGPEIVIEKNAAGQETKALNIWTPPKLVPVECAAEDVALFTEHLVYIFDGDAGAVKYMLDHLAHQVQQPAVKIKSSALLIGAPGIGKSLIGEMMTRLLGEENCTAIEDSDLRSAFNEWMDGVSFVLINELMSCDSREAMNRLKNYLTDPWIRINRKKVQTYRYRNRVNFFMCSNYEDAARLDKGDRRWFIWISKAAAKPREYYKTVWHWFDNGGAEQLLWFLQYRDISKFDPNEAPPVTAGKLQVIADSRSPTEAYLQELFDAGARPFMHDLVSVTGLVKWFADQRLGHLRVNHKAVTQFLRGDSVKALYLDKRELRDGTRPRLWAIRNGEAWRDATIDGIQAAWRDIDEQPLTDDQWTEYLRPDYGRPVGLVR